MTDAYNFAELTKEMIASRLKDAADAPAMAAEIAKQTIVAGIRGTRAAGQSPEETVKQICFGAMSGLLLIQKDLPQGTVRILQCLADAAQELHMDPAELMTWAMEAVAKLSHLVSPEIGWKIREAMEEAFHGTGEVFDQLCERQKRG